MFGKVPHQLCIRHYIQNLKDKLGEGKIAEFEYSDACQSLQQGVKPKYLKVPNDLFTFRAIKQLPPTNQQIENLNRYLMLRLKTMGQFQSFPSAKCYCNALTLMRRFVAFTDCRNKAMNRRSPLEIAGCDVKELDYLMLQKFRR